RTRAVSAIVSPLPRCISLGLRYSDCTPNWYIPTSKDTLVRVEGFSKNNPMLLPISGHLCESAPDFRASALSNRYSISFFVRSCIVRRSRFILIGSAVRQGVQPARQLLFSRQ